MSDFDKEAERQKLREKLERDEEAREATEHMSELLLKGATMTNKHCDDCGDPVFRYQGQEFCPTCGQEIVEEDESGGAEQAAATGANANGEDASGEAAPVAQGPDDSAGQPAAAPAPQPGTTASQGGERSGNARAAQRGTNGDDLQAARAALVRKLGRLAQQAEATDDVARSRDLLGAAKEAAEALAAVDQVRR